MEFDFEVHHRPGRNHIAVDALSRLSTTQTDDPDIFDDIQAYAAADNHAKIDHNAEEEVEELTI